MEDLESERALTQHWRTWKKTDGAQENGWCSTDHMIQWSIIRNVILYEKHVRRNLFSNTNDNKNSASTLLSGILYFVVCLCSCGSVVEHYVSTAKGCGFDSQGTHIVIKTCIA